MSRSVEAKDSELFVIHALGVDSMFSGKGIAKQMVRKAMKIAHENNIKTILFSDKFDIETEKSGT